jgi:outer membrane lipoprotein carrier protein
MRGLARHWLALAGATVTGLALAGACSAADAAAAGTGTQRPAGSKATATQPATALEHFLDGFRTLTTDFTQSVTDASGKRSGGGSGRLVVQRPDRFRWDYRPAEAASAASAGGADEQGQLLVADGSNVWFLDRELAQVTVKPIAAALSSTPIMLLSGSQASLHAQFDISALPSQQGLQWVQVRPRGAQADFSEARLGFHGYELVRMIVHNMLGQSVQLDFSHSRRNSVVDPALFHFQVPPGVDVIGSPVPSGAAARP